MCPLVACHAGYAPEHTQWFYCPGTFYFTHVLRFPAESSQDFRNCFLCTVVISADKHGWLSLFELRLVHKRIPHTVKCLNQFCLRQETLNTLPAWKIP